MDKMQEIKKYVDTMKVKKVLLGGYDKEDVSKHVGNIVSLAQQHSEECKRREADLTEKYQIRMEALEMTIESLSTRLEVALKEKEEADKEKERLKEFYQECCSKIIVKYSDSLKTLSGEFSKVIDNITVLQRNILEADVAEMFGIETQIMTDAITVDDVEIGEIDE